MGRFGDAHANTNSNRYDNKKDDTNEDEDPFARAWFRLLLKNGSIALAVAVF